MLCSICKSFESIMLSAYRVRAFSSLSFVSSGHIAKTISDILEQGVEGIYSCSSCYCCFMKLQREPCGSCSAPEPDFFFHCMHFLATSSYPNAERHLPVGFSPDVHFFVPTFLSLPGKCKVNSNHCSVATGYSLPQLNFPILVQKSDNGYWYTARV